MTIRHIRRVVVPLTLLVAPLPFLMLGCGGSATAPAATTPATPNPAPAVVISGASTATATGPVTFTFTFSVPVSAFPASAVTVTGGTAAATTTKLSPNQYTLVVTPPANTTGTISVTVAAGAFSSAAGVASTTPASVTQGYNTVVNVTPPGFSVFADDYAAGVGYAPFSGSSGAPVVDTAVFHDGTASLRFDVPSSNYIGGALASSTPVDLSSYNALSFWVKGSKAVTLDVAGLGNDANGNTAYSAESTAISLTTSWQQYLIPIPVPAKLTASTGMVHFANGSENGAFSFWVDDIQYVQLASTVVGAPTGATVGWPTIPTLTIGGVFVMPSGPNTVTYTLPVLATGQLTNVGFGYFTVTGTPSGVATVDATGTVKGVSAGTTSLSATFGSLTVPGSDAVTVVASIAAPTSGASAPTLPGNAIVLQDSSNAALAIPIGNWNPGWGQAGSIAPYTAGSASILLMDLINYQGVDISGPNGNATDTAPSPISIANAMTLHISYWTPDGSAFTLVPIDANDTQEGSPIPSGNLAQGAWTDLDLPMPKAISAGGTFDPTTLRQLKFVTTAAENIYMDNIYFH